MTSVFTFLSNYDYIGFFRMKGRLHPIEEFETWTHQNSASGSAPYINNFIFIHESKLAQFHAAIVLEPRSLTAHGNQTGRDIGCA